ncbi:MAG: hypothetical protein U9Q62_11715 [Campylobacterota bacterium]|nr:hypothetical protein [Campylobacterota bacterium]
MSITPSVKRHNHRVHPCSRERKDELLTILIAKHAEQSILVVTADDPEPIKKIVDNENITVTSDAALKDAPEKQYDLLISYDLPDTAIAYMIRLARAKTHALILLDPGEQKKLYPIETLLGRNLLEEVISGFELLSDTPKEKEEKSFQERKPKRDHKPRRDDQRSDRKRDERPSRDDKRPARKPFASDTKDEPKSEKWSKKERGPSKYIGKDEDGKPIFSGKTRERNHRYDGTPKSDEEKAASKRRSGKPKYSGTQDKKRSDKPRSFENKKQDDSREKKPWDKSKSFDSNKPKKSYDSTSKSKRPDAKKPVSKRPPRIFKKSLEQQKESK